MKIDQDVTLSLTPSEFQDLQDLATTLLSLEESNATILTVTERELLSRLQEA